jgi:hypothetical protein
MMKNTKAPKEEQSSHPAVNGKDEQNLAEFPIGRLGVKDKRESITYEGWVTNKQGERYKQLWRVSAPKDYGLPHELGNRMLVAFISLAAQQQSREVTFVDHQMLKLLRLSDGKANYKHFERNLLSLSALTIYSEKAFWDNDKKKHITTTKEAFHIFEHVWLSSWVDDDTGQPKEYGYVVFNEIFWKNIQSGYLKTLNLEVYLSVLKNPITRQLYRCLDKLMRYRNEFEIDIYTLASKIGLITYKYPSQLLQKLKPGLEELLAKGFLTSADVVKVGKYTRMRFVKGAKQKLLEQESSDEIAPALSHTTPDTQGIEIKKTWRDKWQDNAQKHNISPEYLELWFQVLTLLETQINKGSFITFVADTFLLSIEDDTATVVTGNSFSQDWLVRQMRKQFRDELNLFLREAGKGKVSSVRIVPASGASN